MSNNDILFEVNGFKVRANSYYIVKDKDDKSAPTGMQKLGISKMPADGVDEGFYCSGRAVGKRRDKFNPEREVTRMLYDTGFYTDSPMYASKPESEVKKQVQDLNKSIVRPMEKLYGKGHLAHDNYEFWEGKQFKLRSEQLLKTDKLEDLLTLYIALAHKRLVPKGSRKDGNYKKALYIVVDKATDKEVGEERDSIKLDSSFEFISMYKRDKATLVNLLSYLGLYVDDKASESSLKTTFKGWIDQEHGNLTNAKRFLEKCKEISNKGHWKEIINIYPVLKTMVNKGIIERDSEGMYHYKDTALGTEIKAAAHKLCTDKELKVIKDTILMGE